MKIKKEEIIIILLAGGYGKRLSSTVNKQMIKVNGITVLEKSIINFQNYLPNIPIQIVTNKENINNTNEIAKKFNLYSPIIGGKERQLSVFNALKHLKKNSPRYVLIHDSARPIISKEVLNALIQFKKTSFNCVVPILSINDAIRVFSNYKIQGTLDKNDKVLAQTPQFCDYEVLLNAHINSKKLYEDESALLLSQSFKIDTVKGNPKTLKLTYIEDLHLLEPHLLKDEQKYITKIGNGYDIHRFDINSNDNKNFIKLGGIKISNSKSLIAHSDADVLLHAITDSILGIVNKGDIGSFFPPTDNKWKNADSSIFLKYASNLLKEVGGIINNIDAIVICEKPKILNYSQEIKDNIATILKINPKIISIKGKTSESIGFIGRQEGIAAMVVTSAQVINDNFDA
ncbi:MAG: 2-C-methyl-D-erythritol 2,4-cyclodiphosphate synthase [Alphaproteobacteria bacterium TMED194]|nr:MAG: 2-C-methyl-D-erythritol 2,4-cyclodiphosphate synthase [Alphaproteobacteria bacterium TMED194]